MAPADPPPGTRMTMSSTPGCRPACQGPPRGMPTRSADPDSHGRARWRLIPKSDGSAMDREGLRVVPEAAPDVDDRPAGAMPPGTSLSNKL